MAFFLRKNRTQRRVGILSLPTIIAAAGVLFLCGRGAAVSGAEEGNDFLSLPWQMEADRIVHLNEQQEMQGEGNVVLQRLEDDSLQPLIIRADRLDYSLQTGEVQASGGIEVSIGQDIIRAESVELNLQEQTGRLSNTSIFLADKNLFFSGASVEKTSEFSYRFEDGYLTSCNVKSGQSAPWAIKAGQTELTMDEYAVLRNATFRIRDIPIFYTPYLIMPAKISRQTGLLFPEISNSNLDGIGVISPLFVEINPSIDITLMPGYLDKRGALLAAEFRYAAAPLSFGSFTLQYQDDRSEDTASSDYKSDGYLRQNNDRYWFRGKVDHRFENRTQLRLDVDMVSDADFLIEFRKGMLGFDESHAGYMGLFHRGLQEKSIPYRESTLQISKSWPTSFLGAELRGVDDPDYDVFGTVASDSPIHTLPRILMTGRSPIFGPFAWKWDSEYDYFWREKGVGAQRLDLQPALSASLPLGPLFEGMIQGGLRQTMYQVEENGETEDQWTQESQAERTLWTGSMSLATLLYRNFSWFQGGTHNRLRHLVRPQIGYEFLSQADQDDLPEFDLIDRLERKSKLQAGLHQFFMLTSTQPDGSISQRKLGILKVYTDYDLHEARRTIGGINDARQPFSDINFDLELFPLKGLYVRYQTALNVYGEGVKEYELLTRYADILGNFISLDYRYERDAAHELDFDVGARIGDRYYVQLGTKRSLLTGRTVEEDIRLVFHPHCWSMEVEFARTEDDDRVMVLFSLDGIGKVFEWGVEQL